MVKEKFIRPAKPTLKSNYFAAIFLKKSEVDISDIKEKAINKGYREQTARHITILNEKSAAAIQNVLDSTPSQAKEIIIKLKSILNKFDWSFTPGKIYHIQKHGIFNGRNIIERRETYIRTVSMPDMLKFYQELNKLLNAKLPVQFPHITLFTRGERPNPDYYGISVPSKEDFEKLNPIEIV